ncbi:MAG: hypothetical protein ACQESC_04525, partial [Nanobdellota archaeon]
DVMEPEYITGIVGNIATFIAGIRNGYILDKRKGFETEVKKEFEIEDKHKSKRNIFYKGIIPVKYGVINTTAQAIVGGLIDTPINGAYCASSVASAYIGTELGALTSKIIRNNKKISSSQKQQINFIEGKVRKNILDDELKKEHYALFNEIGNNREYKNSIERVQHNIINNDMTSKEFVPTYLSNY